MKRTYVTLLIIVIVTVLALRSAPKTPGAIARAPVSGQKHCGGWSIVPSPNPSSYVNALYGVAAVSPSDVWAVGVTGTNGGPGQTLVEHWNGTRWQVVSSPNAGGSDLYGVTALSASDAWAVGDSASVTQTLIEHWDGYQWRVVPSPSIGHYQNELVKVSAVSARDIWAVGYDDPGPGAPNRTLIEHWDGTKWSIVSSPNGNSSYNTLQGVSAISSSDVWAVGGYSTGRYNYAPLALHWDGTRWRLSPAHIKDTTFFFAVTAISTADVWAVGSYGNGPWTEHWDGHRWHGVPSPNPPGGFSNNLQGVASGGSSTIWAVGSYSTWNNHNRTLTQEWTGKQWQVVPSPNKVGGGGGTYLNNYLTGVAVTSAPTVWAVGYTQPHDVSSATTLIESYC